VSAAPRCTSPILVETRWVPWAACWTLREISCVAAPALPRPRNRRGNLRQPPDGAADLPDRADRFLGRGLDAGDLLSDLACGLRGLLGKRLDIGGNDGKAAAGLTGTRGLDGGVQRQQVGLAGDGADQLDHVADACGRLGKLADAIVGLACLAYGLAGNAGRIPAPGGRYR